MYDGGSKPAIVLSSLRPLGRRMFTCGHELGHHVFGHGSRLDEIKEKSMSGNFQPEEFLADSFAGFLLMPSPGLRRAFLRRGLNAEQVTPLDIVRISTDFGVGFDTLVTQLGAQKIINNGLIDGLRKKGINSVRKEILADAEKTPLYVLDT
ncbi:MAG TPA: ImmA/IrrE family metallo-endopeptidase, partial [Fimbriimonas sp.]|nr:ImmA/IrrE family metallo-endopeptidase [Fimbriimonas sp.]